MAKNQLRPIVKSAAVPKLAKAGLGGRRGRPPRQREGAHQAFTLRMPAELHRDLRHFALDEGRSLNEILLDAVESWWAARTPATKKRRRA